LAVDRLRIPKVVAFLTVLALVAGACNDGDGDDQVDGGNGELPSYDLTIGAFVTLTGALSAYGGPSSKAMELAVQEANEAAEEIGADIEFTLETEDSQTDPEAAIAAGRTLVTGGANCLISGGTTPETIGVAQSITIPRNIPIVVGLATSGELTTFEDQDTVYRTSPPDRLQAVALSQAMDEELGGAEDKLVSIAYRNEPYGEGLSDSFTEEWESVGGEIQGPVAFDPGVPSYNSEADQIVSGDPNAFLVIDYPDTYARMGAALVRTGEFDASTLFVPDAMALPEVPNNIPDQALEQARGMQVGAPETAAAEGFHELYTSAPGPGRFALDANAFDAAALCMLASVAAGSDDPADILEHIRDVSGPPGDPYTFEDFGDAMEALAAGEDIDYEGVSGPLNLDQYGDPTGGVYELFRYENGNQTSMRLIEVDVPGS
jgi:ABC-type branched-subunit amino acid transport system substrate-binding protein